MPWDLPRDPARSTGRSQLDADSAHYGTDRRVRKVDSAEDR